MIASAGRRYVRTALSHPCPLMLTKQTDIRALKRLSIYLRQETHIYKRTFFSSSFDCLIALLLRSLNSMSDTRPSTRVYLSFILKLSLSIDGITIEDD